jgi:hypothetical protein
MSSITRTIKRPKVIAKRKEVAKAVRRVIRKRAGIESGVNVARIATIVMSGCWWLLGI